MAKRQSQDEAKVVVTIRNISGGMRENTGGANYKTVKLHDNRTGEDWPMDVIEAQGIIKFLSLNDIKQTLNKLFKGDIKKYRIEHVSYSEYVAYVF